MEGMMNKLKETVGAGHTHSENVNQPRTENQASRQPENSYGNQANTNSYNTNTTTSSSSSHLPDHKNQVLRGVDPLVTSNDAPRESNVSSSTLGERNPRDAAHVPPSVMAQQVGAPSIEHDYPHDSKTKRHSISTQEEHLIR